MYYIEAAFGCVDLNQSIGNVGLVDYCQFQEEQVKAVKLFREQVGRILYPNHEQDLDSEKAIKATVYLRSMRPKDFEKEFESWEIAYFHLLRCLMIRRFKKKASHLPILPADNLLTEFFQNGYDRMSAQQVEEDVVSAYGILSRIYEMLLGYDTGVTYQAVRNHADFKHFTCQHWRTFAMVSKIIWEGMTPAMKLFLHMKHQVSEALSEDDVLQYA